MKLVRRDPFSYISPFGQWQSLLNEDMFEGNNELTAYETEDEFVVKANVAGVPAEEVEVSLEGGVVTIRAEHEESEEENKKKKVVYKEARKAQYLYTTSIPFSVQADKAKAEVNDGVVTLSVPKAEEAKPKKVKVLAKGK